MHLRTRQYALPPGTALPPAPAAPPEPLIREATPPEPLVREATPWTEVGEDGGRRGSPSPPDDVIPGDGSDVEYLYAEDHGI